MLSQLYQLGVDSINSEFCGLTAPVTIKRSIHVKFAILGIALSQDTLNIIRDKLLIVFSIILENTFNKF